MSGQSKIIYSYHRRKTYQNRGIIAALAGALVLAALISLSVGYSSLTFADVIRIITGSGSDNEILVLFSFRLPRIVLSIMVGMGLSAAGCLLQGVTGNALADTGILGINAGAGLTVVLYVLFFGTGSMLAVFTLPVAALTGALGAALLIYLLIRKKTGVISPFSIIMTGIAVQAGLSALMTLLVVKLDDTQYAFVSSWQVGSIWGANWHFVLALMPWLCILLAVIMSKVRVLDVLVLGKETATALGVKIQNEQKNLLFFAVALAGTCVSVSGSISFVGLMAPHIARRLVGPRHHVMLPVCIMTGALLVLVSDTIARVIIQPSSLPTGVVVSIIGAPYLIYLLTAQQKYHERN